MDAKHFYGSTTVRDLKRKRRLECAEFNVQNDNFVIPGSNILKNDEEFRVFSVQSLALAQSDDQEHHSTMCFAFELDRTGKRNFCVTHPGKMWSILRSRKSHKRHFYEVIPQGWPCKLYFDIEFAMKNNHGQGLVALTGFINYVKNKVRETFGIQVMDEEIIDLDSSVPDRKFSHHLIFDNPQLIFASNFSAGNFVKKIMSEIPEELKRSISFQNNNNKEDVFVDLGVYTKNRNFRMFLCSKFGKTTVLKLSKSCSPHLKTLNPLEIFFKSLICYFKDRPLSSITPLNVGEDRNFMKTPSNKSSTVKKMELSESSPFPEIDDFIASKIENGKIRKIVWKEKESALEYEILGYRFCHNIQREHKSNNIKFVVLLNRGIFFQLCHDPDCSGYKSENWNLPVDCQPWIEMFQCGDDEGFAFGDEEEDAFLLEAAKDY